MKYTNIEAHKRVIRNFLVYLNKLTDRFILKGGTALCMFYENDRFSEDIDLDTEKGNIANVVKNFCKFHGYPSPNEKKDTNYGQKFMIDYGITGQLLKVETSSRNKYIDKETVTISDGIRVYKIGALAERKFHAYTQRDKIRDLYDLAFIINNYWDKLEEGLQKDIITGLKDKHLAQQFDLVTQQDDELIDRDKLETSVLECLQRIGLLDK